MSRVKWKLIKQKKGFYVSIFRRTGTFLVFSTMLNAMLGLSVFYVYSHQPENTFYATNGAMPPLALTPMDAPNITSSPMMADDPVNDDETRAIPQ